MKFKLFLHKVKNDLKKIIGYPPPDFGKDGTVDYDKYWKKRRPSGFLDVLSSWQKQRADLVLPLLENGNVVVDVGGGSGEMLAYWVKLKKIKGICADYNELALEQAKRRGLDTLFLDLNDEKNWNDVPPCDYLTGFEILEHLANPEKFILFVKNKVRKGLIFSVPNSGYYQHRVRLLLGRFPLQWIVHPGEHLRFWTAKDIVDWVGFLGLKLEKKIIYEELPGLNNLLPSLFGQGIIIYIKNEQ